MDELDDDGGGLPLLAWVAIAVLVGIGLITIIGWVVDLFWGVLRLGLIVVVVVGVVALWRTSRRR